MRLVGLASRRLGKCSTPFGITEVGIPGRRLVSPLGHVLNAFRHHRGGHHVKMTFFGLVALCSTPFGITEVGMRLVRRRR